MRTVVKTAAASYTQIVIYFYILAASVVAHFNRARCDAGMAVDAFIFIDIYYRN